MMNRNSSSAPFISGMNSSRSGFSTVPKQINWSSKTNDGERGTTPPHHLTSVDEKDLFSGINSGINFDKYEDIPVEATGSDVPPPFNSFAELDVNELVRSNIKMAKYVKPTPVQKYSIPTLLGHRDLMSCAQTGSGKTAAFLVPLVEMVMRNNKRIREAVTQANGRRCQFPQALILSPTRELAMQTFGEAQKFSYKTNLRSAVLYGGRENYRDQINLFRLGCHILIATPGRLIDIISQGMVSFEDCLFLVLDEADRMLDMGFEPQIRKIVEQSDMPKKGTRVTAMFSATFPKEIQILAQDFLVPKYVFLAVGRVGSTTESIAQRIIWIEEHNKRDALVELIDADEEKGLMLIFVETKKRANELAWTLQRSEYNVVPIHGDLAQYERERHLRMFRTGEANLLVATAVAARGLDIPNVKHVVNYDLPGDIDEYVHRIGRTGRAGNTGLATSFFNDKNFSIGRDLIDLLVEANQEVPAFLQDAVMSNYGSRPNKGRGRFGGRDHRMQQNKEMHSSYSVPAFPTENPSRNWNNSTSTFSSGSTFKHVEQRSFRTEGTNGFQQQSNSFGFMSYKNSGNPASSGFTSGWSNSVTAKGNEPSGERSGGFNNRPVFDNAFQW